MKNKQKLRDEGKLKSVYIYVYVFLRCAEFSYRKVEQALKSAFGKGLRTKERRTWN